MSTQPKKRRDWADIAVYTVMIVMVGPVVLGAFLWAFLLTAVLWPILILPVIAATRAREKYITEEDVYRVRHVRRIREASYV